MDFGIVRWVFHVSWLCSHLQLVDTIDYTFSFSVLTQPCISGINPTRSWCIIFLYVTGFDLLLLLEEFYIYVLKGVLVCNILCWVLLSLLLVLVSRYWWPHKMNCVVFLPLLFPERVCVKLMLVRLQIFGRILHWNVSVYRDLSLSLSLSFGHSLHFPDLGSQPGIEPEYASIECVNPNN